MATQYLLSDKIDDGLGRIDVGGTTEVRWTLTDFQKSVRTILDGTGAVIGDLAYDAFGNKTLETAPTMSGEYGYTGREWDKETELQYNRARWYDPKTARWLTQDPLGFDAGDSNLYRYVNNQATGAVDPSGLIPDGPGSFPHVDISKLYYGFLDWWKGPSVPAAPKAAQDELLGAKKDGEKGPPLILSWKDFKEVDGKKDWYANTAWTWNGEYDYKYKFGAPVKKGDDWIATGEVWVEKWNSFPVNFNAEKSYVQKGKKTADLLGHENLHFVIAKYIGKKAERNAPLTKVNFTAQGKTEAAARAATATAAKNKITETLDMDFYDVWRKIDMAATEAYDKKSNHSQDVEGQVDWFRNWQIHVDEIAIRNGWKK